MAGVVTATVLRGRANAGGDTGMSNPAMTNSHGAAARPGDDGNKSEGNARREMLMVRL
jgi:hypothetical protein